ncbi:MAG: 50S ribosomal protein L6 [Rhodobacteraceae bacterium]|nr:50S ribosomal protein L6 [Paracoccaceae bacterium]
MSRIGKNPVPIPDSVKAGLDGDKVSVEGPLGSQAVTVAPEARVSMKDGTFVVSPVSDSKKAREQWGLMRSLIANSVTGVTTGFRRELLITGVGYRAQMRGDVLNMVLGLSHEVNVKAPDGVTIETPSTGRIIVKGINKQQVGQTAAEIRRWRPPEPFKGKGIRYADEYVYRKVGKKK